MYIWCCEWKIMLLYGVIFIINFLRILKIIIFKKKIYVNVKYVRWFFSNRCVFIKRDV